MSELEGATAPVTDVAVEAPSEPFSLRGALEKALATQNGGEAPAKSEGAPAKADDAPPADDLAPLDFWSDDTKKQYTSFEANVRKAFLDATKSANADYTKKTMALAEQRKALEAISQAADKWKPHLSQLNLTPDKALDILLGVDYTLRTGTPEQKRQVAQKLLRDYGISDLAQLTEPSDQWTDPEIKALKEEVHALKSKYADGERTVAERTHQEAMNEVKAFMEELDEQGNLKHPHFEKLAPQMNVLLRANPKLPLEHVYDKAMRLDDDLYKELQEKAIKSAQAKMAANAKHAAEKAKKAQGLKVDGAGPVNGKDRPSSIRETMERAAAELN